MKIAITESKTFAGKNSRYPWQVRMDQHVVSFRSEAQACAFVETLQARLRAPHALPVRNRQRSA
ncbi:hypothetical protein [Pseudomonas sp. dw_358]|uniref:hypothetical protein n=1 Tax=Pseudomonas sp. dw_358 TaxID=2720083 RepID=UPI001BD5B738|nr:hypothetical protein [Pseudomonas sp. dw_358]